MSSDAGHHPDREPYRRDDPLELCAECAEPTRGQRCGRCGRPLCEAHTPEVMRRCQVCEQRYAAATGKALWLQLALNLTAAVLMLAGLVAGPLGRYLPAHETGAALVVFLLIGPLPCLFWPLRRLAFLGRHR